MHVVEKGNLCKMWGQMAEKAVRELGCQLVVLLGKGEGSEDEGRGSGGKREGLFRRRG
jgi:hypothetical protein